MTCKPGGMKCHPLLVDTVQRVVSYILGVVLCGMKLWFTSIHPAILDSIFSYIANALLVVLSVQRR